MSAFERVDEVGPSPEFGNSGSAGWAFTLWGSPSCEELAHRRLLETFAAAYPASALHLPPQQECEDLIEGSLVWEYHPVSIWFETGLNFTFLWSSDRAALFNLRQALLPFACAA